MTAPIVRRVDQFTGIIAAFEALDEALDFALDSMSTELEALRAERDALCAEVAELRAASGGGHHTVPAAVEDTPPDPPAAGLDETSL